MSKKGIARAVSDKAPKEKPKLSVRVPQGSDVKLEGFDTAVVGKMATVIVKGKVTELSQVQGEYEWNNGRRIELVIDSCEVEGPGGAAESMDAAIAATRQRV